MASAGKSSLWTKLAQKTEKHGSPLSSSNLDNCDPELCIQLLRMPTVQNYAGLKKRLSKSDKEWMTEFLELDGMEVLVESLERLSDKGFSSFADAYLQIECIGCIKAVLNSKTGLNFIIETRDIKQYTRNLASALDTTNVLTKKMVFEILSALSVYSADGCSMAVDALEYYKTHKNQRYRFSLVINELKAAEVVAYKTTLFGFVNSLLFASEETEERRRLRNEFIGLGLLDIIGSLRHEEDPDLCIQLNVFDEQKNADDEEVTYSTGIDIDNPIDVFHAVFNKVSNSPQGMVLLSILQHMLQLEPDNPVSDVIWHSMETFLRHATVLDSKRQIEDLMDADMKQTRGCDSEGGRDGKGCCRDDKEIQCILDSSHRLDQNGNSNGLVDSKVDPCETVVKSDAIEVQSADPEGKCVCSKAENQLSSSPLSQTITSCGMSESESIPVPAVFPHQLQGMPKPDVPQPTVASKISTLPSSKEPSEIPTPPPLPSSGIPGIPAPPPLPGSGIPPPPPLPGSGIPGIPAPPPLPGSGIPPPPPLPGLGIPGIPPPPPLPGSGIPGIPSPPPLPGSGIPPPPPLPGLGIPGIPPPPPLPGSGIPGIPSPPPLPGLGIPGIPPPPPLPGSGIPGIPAPPPLPGSGIPPPPPLPGSGIPGIPAPPPLPGSGIPPPPPLPGSGIPGIPAPPPLPGSGIPPPPPLPGSGIPAPPPPPPGGIPPPPGGLPPPPPAGGMMAAMPNMSLYALAGIGNSVTGAPKPKVKLKVFNWTKIPPRRLTESGKNIWRSISIDNPSPELVPQYDKLEELFCLKKAGTDKSKSEKSVKPKEPTEINLLDGKRSLNVNIFLKQFKMSSDAIVLKIEKGDSVTLGAERLRGLIKLLPESSEVDMLTSFTGDKAKLGNAEQFFLKLLKLTRYELRLQSMLMKEEFATNLNSIKPALDSIIKGGQCVLESKALEEFLKLVLATGNYMNSGGYAGNAVGFKVSSLLKLSDTRANVPRMTLLHHLVDVFGEKAQHNFTQLLKDFGPVSEACRHSVESLTADVNDLSKRLGELQEQVSAAEEDIKQQVGAFLEGALEDCAKLEKSLQEIDQLTTELASYFCEDAKTFKLEELFSTINNFTNCVKQSREENRIRKVQEEKAREREKQQKLKEEKKKEEKQKQLKAAELTSSSDEESCIIDSLLNDIAKGFHHSKKRRLSQKSRRKPGAESPQEENKKTLDELLMAKSSGSAGKAAINGNDMTVIDGSRRRVRSRNTKRSERLKSLEMTRERVVKMEPVPNSQQPHNNNKQLPSNSFLSVVKGLMAFKKQSGKNVAGVKARGAGVED